jgi:uncharacterized protein (DUF58 family)
MDMTALARLRKLQIISKKISKSGLIGDYASAFKGVGIEFDQLRAYVPGDDVRTIDWSASARTSETMVKTFIQERDRTIIVAIDTSSSMFYSSTAQLKYDLASSLLGALGSIAVNSHDHFGAVLFSSQVDAWYPPTRGLGNLSRIIDAVSAVDDSKRRATSFEQLASFLLQQNGRKNVVLFIISDFMDEKLFQLSSISALVKRYDLTAFSVVDPCEVSFPEFGVFSIQNIESGDFVEVDSRKFNKIGLFMKKKADFFRKKGISHFGFDLNAPWLPSLARFFKDRTRRQV